MARYIVTRQNADGTFDQVGMSNIMLISDYKTYRNAYKYAINPFGNGKLCRVEVYGSSVYTAPLQTFTVTTTPAA
jgi:hypothetical protein